MAGKHGDRGCAELPERADFDAATVEPAGQRAVGNPVRQAVASTRTERKAQNDVNQKVPENKPILTLAGRCKIR